MAISTNQNPTIYRNLHENTGPVWQRSMFVGIHLPAQGFRHCDLISHRRIDKHNNIFLSLNKIYVQVWIAK